MRKLIALLLALTLGAAPALAVTPGQVVGAWYVVSMTGFSTGGPFAPVEAIRLDLNRDASADLTFGGEAAPGEAVWDVTADGVKVTGVGEDAADRYLRLTLTEDGLLTYNLFRGRDGLRYDVTFAREPADVSVPAVVEAESEEAFYGAYQAECMVAGDRFYSYAGAADALRLEIAFAQVDATLGAGGEDERHAVGVTDYVDGALRTSASGIFTRRSGVACTIAKLEDGGVVATYEEDGEARCVYFSAR